VFLRLPITHDESSGAVTPSPGLSSPTPEQ
jgi:hypothetical protein